ncbi:DUF885 family protein [bacterium]|nr:DUF885 family protein [bacterium]
MNRRTFCQSLLALGLTSLARARSQQSAQDLRADFLKMGFPDFSMDLEENLKAPAPSLLLKQKDWLEVQRSKYSQDPPLFHDLQFLSLWNQLLLEFSQNPAETISSRIDPSKLSPAERTALEPFLSPHGLRQERWRGLVCLPSAKQWYELYVAFWTSFFQSDRYHPVRLGEVELSRIQQELDQLSGLKNAEDRMTDESVLRAEFQKLDQRVRALQLWDQPPPAVNFAPMPPGPVKAPGFYRDGTFFYNLSPGGFLLRNLNWLYLHEVMPGHHLQVTAAAGHPTQALLTYPGLQEGWAVYAEQLGSENGLLSDPVQRLGWLLWDQVRCARVLLDWRIHVDGWSLGQAIEWWNENLPGQRELAYPEVARVLRWPAQSLSYKVGGAEMLRLRARARQEWGDTDADRRFHKTVLSCSFNSWDQLEDQLFGSASGSPRKVPAH